MATLSVDLSTLTGWSDVTSGSHTLTIKAKATGYRDSEASTGVSFTKGGSITVRLAGLDQTGYGYYKVNNGSETQIPAANYITFPATKEKCDADGIALTGVTSLEVYSEAVDMAYCYIYDTSFEFVTGISAAEWADITQYLQDGYYVLVESND